MSAKVFISYGEEDYEIAKRLYDDLKDSGFNPWMNKENILLGQKQKLEIRRAIQESSYFLILLSEKSLSDRGYFHKELKIALEILDEMPPDKIFILPVRLDTCKPAYEILQGIQHTDLFPLLYEKGFRQILRALGFQGDEKENRRFVGKSVLETLAEVMMTTEKQLKELESGIIDKGTYEAALKGFNIDIQDGDSFDTESEKDTAVIFKAEKIVYNEEISRNTLWGILWGIFRKRRATYKKEINEIEDVIDDPPLELAKYYVEPDVQDVNPANYDDEISNIGLKPVMKLIDNFSKGFNRDYKQMLILSDAGMGKSSLLVMLKLRHLKTFGPKKKDYILKKLGETTLQEVAQIENRSGTILLLDALDEDPDAHGRVRDRLTEILGTTQNFFRVIITCRTQFFPKVSDDLMKREGFFRIDEFSCPVKYLSFFSDDKVKQYLSKRFPKYYFFTDKKKVEKAMIVIDKMGSLRCRPLLLSYIEDLMDSPLIEINSNEYDIYNALVRSWLFREKRKPKNKGISEENLLKACIILATIMRIRQKRRISEKDLVKIINNQIAEVSPIKKLEMKGRSLINCNSEGDYGFSHYTIQEFCIAKLLLEEPVFNPKGNIPLTDFIFRQILTFGKSPNFIPQLDFKDLIFNNFKLKGLKLPGANLQRMDLSGADLTGADLSNADLSESNLSRVNLSGANLSGANLNKADFSGVDLSSLDLKNVNLRGAELSKADFNKLDFSELDSSNSNLLINAMHADTVLEPKRRVDAGNVLSELGDPRFNPDMWYLPDDKYLGFVKIPAGKFIMGSEQAHIEALTALTKKNDDIIKLLKSELHQHTVELSEYRIARYPVTVAQYKAFLDDTDQKADDDWHTENEVANHPVVMVAWNNAIAYCEWLTEKLKDRGWHVLLPTEAQWEKAARGTKGYIYSWGNDEIDPNRANFRDTRIGKTSPVGCFPKGRSPYELTDMIGNVWEWCQDAPREYSYETVTNPFGSEGTDRVARGGGWTTGARSCRSTYRIRRGPADRIMDQGFRLIVTMPDRVNQTTLC
ncbi:MAG: SUMF1/EgtB/PvdO family nonheme iron enzyme [Desulfobacterales bacterium]|nr:SUMF1/EgtB/PvdO family nonheme iron enzyme [Desulfobacterales bacterium]